MNDYKFLKTIVLCLLFWAEIVYPALSAAEPAADFKDLAPLIKTHDAVVVTESDGKVLFSKNADQPLIPASTLKLLTSLAAFHYLGEDFRFITEFYIDDRANLTVKGYGDPPPDFRSPVADGRQYCRNFTERP